MFAFDDGIERWKAPSNGVPKKLGIPSQQTERHGNRRAKPANRGMGHVSPRFRLLSFRLGRTQSNTWETQLPRFVGGYAKKVSDVFEEGWRGCYERFALDRRYRNVSCAVDCLRDNRGNREPYCKLLNRSRKRLILKRAKEKYCPGESLPLLDRRPLDHT